MRTKQEYKTYIFYLEGCELTELTPEEFFIVGLLYNFTGQGNRDESFKVEKVAGPDAFTKQHHKVAGIKKLTRNERKALYRVLIDKGWVTQPKAVKAVETDYKGKQVQKIYTHIRLTDEALFKIKKAKEKRDEPKVAFNTLF